MLINSLASAAPSPAVLCDAAAPVFDGRLAPAASAITACAAAPRQLADSGLGAFVRERGWIALSGTGVVPAGITGGIGVKASGYAQRLDDQPGGGSVATPDQFRISTVKASTSHNSTDYNSTDQMARLIPAVAGGVGPHPGREPEPA
jgi:hypothetical protein